MPPRILILILNYQQPALTIRLLQSCAALRYPNLTILVVDNASQDNSVSQILAACPTVHMHRNLANVGFAAGVNAGLKIALASEADYILLLNNDTFVAPDMLAELVTAAQTYQTAVTAPLIYYEAQPETIWSAGAFRQSLTGDVRQNHPSPTNPLTTPCEVDYVTACGMLVRHDVWQDVGLYDEQFFMYYEDLDWCWRLQATPHRILLVPSAKMWHRVAATIGGNDSPNERYYMALSSVLFFRKHTQGWRWPIVLVFRLLSALKTSWRLRQNHTALKRYWQGLTDGLQV